MVSILTTVALGFTLYACGSGDGSFPTASQSGKSSGGDSSASLARSGEDGGIRTHVPGLPSTGHPDFGLPPTVTVSGQVVVQRVSESARARGLRDTFLQGGSVVGTTLDGTVLGSATTDENGFYSLDLPSGTDDIFVTATDGSTIVLKAAVARLPDDQADVDADSSTTAAYAEGEVGTVGTNLDFDALVDTLKTQVNRETSLLKEIATVNQGIIDAVVASDGTRVANANANRENKNPSLFVRVAQTVIGFLSDHWIRTVTAQENGNDDNGNDDGAPAVTTFDKILLFLSGDLKSDNIVSQVATSFNVQRNRVTGAGQVVSGVARALAKLKQNRDNLTEEQQTSIATALAAAINAANVTDSESDALSTVSFLSFVNETIDATITANESGDATDQAIANSLLNAATTVAATVNNAITTSQLNQVTLSEQIDFGTIVNQIATEVSTNLSDQGVDDATSNAFLGTLLTNVADDLINTTPDEASEVLDIFIANIDDVANVDFTQVQENLQQDVQQQEQIAQQQDTSTSTTTTTSTTSTSTTTSQGTTTTTALTTSVGYYGYHAADTESRILEFFELW